MVRKSLLPPRLHSQLSRYGGEALDLPRALALAMKTRRLTWSPTPAGQSTRPLSHVWRCRRGVGESAIAKPSTG